jgi:peptidoglycan/LPS O-acetylase OafA/YrhL
MKYNPALDGIRALAVLAVVGHHAFVPGFENGRAGVDVFFVLSGYLITTLLAQEHATGGIRLGAFYLRRARRLYPALLGMLALFLSLSGLLWGYTAWRDALIAGLYLSDYIRPEHLSHTWSLAVEEQFYLLWPLVVMGLMRLPNRTRVCLLVLAYALGTIWRCRFMGDFDQSYFGIDTHCTGLILGSLLAFVPTSKWWGLAALPLTWLVYASRQPAELVITQSEWMGAAWVLWAASGAAWPLTAKPLVFLGRISYGIYLYHWLIADYCYRVLDQHWKGILWPSLLGGIALATLSYYTVERVYRVRKSPTYSPANAAAPG